jgi:dCTP deaminase
VILSNIKLQEALNQGRLIITPEPRPREQDPDDPDQYCPYDTHAVDLSLGPEIVIPIAGTYAYDLNQTEVRLSDFISRNSKKRVLEPNEVFVLERNQFVLGMTRETVHLPLDHEKNVEENCCLAARIEGKSSRARIGLLIHFTAPTVHPGFKGPLVLEMINLGPARILLKPGMPIAQLIVEKVDGIPRPNPSQFQGQTGPEGIQGVS